MCYNINAVRKQYFMGEDNMKSTLEILMTIMFDAGIFALLLGFVSGKLTDRKILRVISAAMGVGFVFAEAGKIAAGGNTAVFILCALGFMLSYALFVFSVPSGKKKDNQLR